MNQLMENSLRKYDDYISKIISKELQSALPGMLHFLTRKPRKHYNRRDKGKITNFSLNIIILSEFYK